MDADRFVGVYWQPTHVNRQAGREHEDIDAFMGDHEEMINVALPAEG